MIGRYDEIICEKASKFSIEEIKLQTKQAIQNCETLVKDTCSKIVSLEDETKRVAVFNKHIVHDMEEMLEENSLKVQHQMRTALASQKQKLLTALEEGLKTKLDVTEYSNDQQQKASCQSVSDVIRIQLQI